MAGSWVKQGFSEALGIVTPVWRPAEDLIRDGHHFGLVVWGLVVVAEDVEKAVNEEKTELFFEGLMHFTRVALGGWDGDENLAEGVCRLSRDNFKVIEASRFAVGERQYVRGFVEAAGFPVDGLHGGVVEKDQFNLGFGDFFGKRRIFEDFEGLHKEGLEKLGGKT